MATITVKGHEFNAFTLKDSFQRRAVLFKNNILESLRKLGITENAVEVKLEVLATRKAPAFAEWYFKGHYLYYSYNQGNKFIENLYIVSKVIELEVNELLNGQKAVDEFVRDFSEDRDVEEKRKQAREVLGLSPDTMDMELINKAYKVLAKEYHPDMPNGNAAKFRAINDAHKTLKRELE